MSEDIKSHARSHIVSGAGAIQTDCDWDWFIKMQQTYINTG